MPAPSIGRRLAASLALAAALMGGSLLTPAAFAAPGDDARPAQKQVAADRPTLPPGVEASYLEEKAGEALTNARKSLERVLEDLDVVLPDAEAAEADEQADPPLAAQRLYIAGREAWREKRSFDAITKLEAALKLAPRQPEILRLLGEIYTQSGNVVQGARYLEQAIEVDPSDLSSVFLVGRYASERGRWEAAISRLAPGLEVTEESEDPGLKPLMRFYLAIALERQGYDAAAIEQYKQYLQDMSHPLGRSTRLMGQLAVIHRMQPLKWQSVGDAYLRLGQPEEAIDAYRRASALGLDRSADQLARLAHTHLLLGEPAMAQQLIVQAMAKQATSELVDLAVYVGEASGEPGAIASELRKLYEAQDKPTALVLALAKLMPEDDPDTLALLIDHLEARPGDRVAVLRLIRERIANSDRPLADSVKLAVNVVELYPAGASEFVNALVEAAGGEPQPVIDALEALPKKAEHATTLAMMRGLLLAQAGDTEGAIAALEAVVEENDAGGPRFTLARMLVNAERFDDAETVLKPLIESDKAEAEAVALYVRVLTHHKRYDEAIALLDDLISQGREAVDLTLFKAQLQLDALDDAQAAERTLLAGLTRHPKAEKLYERLLRLYNEHSSDINDAHHQWERAMRRMLGTIPESRLARFERAKLLTHNNAALAERLLRDLVREYPDDQQILAELLRHYLLTGRKSDADALIEGLLKDRGEDPKIIEVAIQYFDGKLGERAANKERVLALLEKLIMLQPEGVARAEQLAQLYIETDRIDKAIATLLAQLDRPIREPGLLLMRLGLALQQADRDAEIGGHFERAMKRFPDHASALAEQWARVLLNDGQPAEAVDVLLKGLNQPKVEDPVVLIGLLKLAAAEADRQDAFTEAAAKAIQRWPEHEVDLRFEWALFYEQVGHAEQAEQMLLALLEKHPNHALSNNHLGYQWVNSDRHLERAKTMIERAVDAEPDNAAYLDSLGWAYYKLGDFKKASHWLKRAVEQVNGTHPVLLDHLGDALHQLGDHGGALRMWKQADMLVKRIGLENLDDPDSQAVANNLPRKIEAAQRQQPVPVANVPDEE